MKKLEDGGGDIIIGSENVAEEDGTQGIGRKQTKKTKWNRTRGVAINSETGMEIEKEMYKVKMKVRIPRRFSSVRVEQA